MSARDFALFVLVCALWGFNMVAAKIVVGQLHVPPLFFGAVRSVLIALAVCPWLLPMPRPPWRTVVVGILMGGGGFGLMFVGLQWATPSAAAIVSQLGVPMVTVLSIVMLGERIRWRRGLGIALAVTGVALVMWAPDGFELSGGLLFVAGGAFCGALGAVMMKQMEGISPLRFQAWVGFASALLLVPLSAGLETGQVEAARSAGWPFALIVLYSALLVSVFAHTAYYGLIQRYDANLIAPLTLMSPLISIGLGIWITGDRFDGRMALGAALALVGVLIVAVRPNAALGKQIFLRNRV
ncbi:MAG TPA: DMT family transporter [Propylenella sp.]